MGGTGSIGIDSTRLKINAVQKERLYVVKLGSAVLNDEKALEECLQQFADISQQKLLVHGGGRLATEMALRLGVPQQMIHGRRITDADTLQIVTMVYAGWVNKKLTASLQAKGNNAIGLSGTDGNLILAQKRENADIDFGFVGDIKQTNTNLVQQLFSQGLTPVLCSITHNGDGQLLNTNADTLAARIAMGLSAAYETHLVYGFEKEGVLSNTAEGESVIPFINRERFYRLKEEGVIADGMLPKLDSAFSAIADGVQSVIIGNARRLAQLVNKTAGTHLRNE